MADYIKLSQRIYYHFMFEVYFYVGKYIWNLR